MTIPLFGPPNIEKMKSRRDVQGLIKALDYEKDGFVRSQAAYALRELGNARAVEPLIAALKDKESGVKMVAVAALGELCAQLGDAALCTRAVQPLIAALGDSEVHVRIHAAEALDRIGSHLEDAPLRARAVEPLIAALDNNDPSVRIEAGEALGRIGIPAVEPLIAVLQGGHSSLRQLAATTLGEIGDPRAVTPLMQIALKPGIDKQERKSAGEALVRIYKQGGLSEEQQQNILSQRDRLTKEHTDAHTHSDRAEEPHVDETTCGEFHGDNREFTYHHDHPGVHSDNFQSTGVDFPL